MRVDQQPFRGFLRTVFAGNILAERCDASFVRQENLPFAAALALNADSDDCGQRFRSKPDADSDRSRTGIPMIPAGVVVDVAYGVS